MKITIHDDTKSISIERKSKCKLHRIIDDFTRLLLAFGFSQKDIKETIQRKSSYVEDLEHRIFQLEIELHNCKKQKDQSFRLIGSQLPPPKGGGLKE